MSEQNCIRVELPWPPSDNAIHRYFLIPGRKAPSTCLSAEAREYFADVDRILVKLTLPKLSGPLRMDYELYPPTRRSIDGPNRHKALQDSLKRREKGRRRKGCAPKWDPKQKAWLFASDDSQVIEWGGKLCGIVPGGKAIVTFTALPMGTQQTQLFTEGDTDDGDADDDAPEPY